MDTSFLITVFVTLFVVIDPISLAPIFVVLTQNMSKQQKRSVAFRSVVLSIFLLFLFGVAGESLLKSVGISIEAFKISGGLLLFATAFEMLFEQRGQRRQKQASHAQIQASDPSVFPLAIPLTAGPGAITSMILLTNHASVTHVLLVHGIMVVVMVLVLVLFLLSDVLQRTLGDVGIKIITRLAGMFLAALAVQFVVDGVRAIVTHA